jgi:hypothetical protein
VGDRLKMERGKTRRRLPLKEIGGGLRACPRASRLFLPGTSIHRISLNLFVYERSFSSSFPFFSTTQAVPLPLASRGPPPAASLLLPAA